MDQEPTVDNPSAEARRLREEKLARRLQEEKLATRIARNWEQADLQGNTVFVLNGPSVYQGGVGLVQTPRQTERRGAPRRRRLLGDRRMTVGLLPSQMLMNTI